ncbi:hypothetical protein B9Z55_008874 [Caenorhabditis nigoni]|uniref:Uncharacterized protein n=1 Tax=Caenorhabditis nigoni TaxID=1611254 RepID=A0A2G5UQ37_9PELO|nr:hypothetical protein B9Z55_008874 [Caenorhabditis nigoni]
MANVEYIVDKFLLLLKMSKIQHKDTQYPHVVLYFFFVMESEIKTVPLQPKEAVIFDFVGGSNDTRNELVKRMIFWLPIHLGDLAGTCHVPEPEMIGEAKYAKNLLNRGTDPENIALIAPYIGQCDLLKKLMDEHIEATGNGIWHNRQYGWPRI